MDAFWDGFMFGLGLIVSMGLGAVVAYMRWSMAVKDRD